METWPSPVPENGMGEHTIESLREARREAVESLLTAERAEKAARAARRRANRKIRKYEQMVQEANGQLRFDI